MSLTQAEVARAVRGAIKAHRESGLPVGSVQTIVSNGRVEVTVTGVADSVQHATVVTGGVNVVEFQEGLRKRHAARRAPTGS